MEMRELGSSGLRIPPLVLGGNVFGWTIDEATSFAVLDAFVAAGFNAVDTANLYSAWAPGNKGGESEAIIGNWLKRRGRRDDVIIATKVGWDMGPGEKGLATSYILRAVEHSLRRLQTDYIDLYQSHIDDPATPVDETLEAYAQLIAQGKVRHIGASNFSAARLKASLEASGRLGFPRYQTLQPHYNLCERAEFEGELEDLCVNERLGVITYFSLASGFLTGKYRSAKDVEGRARADEVGKYVNERGFKILGALDAIAERYRASPTQIALAWLLARPSVTAPIASATGPAQLTALIAATEIKLDPASIAMLDRASASGKAAREANG
jgi:aryl-alcohol dehydrogenase-like predicted oxidoreductase